MLDLSHKKLIAWQKAIALLPLLYKVCQKLPPEEKYNMVGQIKRAGLSISNNLAEGASRRSKPEKIRFFEISRSSAVEIDNCLTAALVLHFLTEADLVELNEALPEVFRLISGLIQSNS